MAREHLQKARQIASVLWVLHAAFWLARDGQTAVFATVAFALVAVVAYGAVRLIFGFWGARVVPLAAMLVLFCKPVLLVKSFFEMAPAGLVALVTSFVLFAIGTVVALMRNRGNKNERSLTETAQINTTL